MDKLQQFRNFLKDNVRQVIDFSQTDQNKGLPAPPIQKAIDSDIPVIDLPSRSHWESAFSSTHLLTAISNRKSRRKFSDTALTIEELSGLLWCTQGIRDPSGSRPLFRTVPSAGARHSFETYLFVFNVSGLKAGLYRYLPARHQLAFFGAIHNLEARLTNACLGQKFTARSAVTFTWTTIPYRMEWRYSLAAHRVILMDAGHVCQNLYLACEAIRAGTCAIGAYDQEQIDALLGVDGKDEFTVYLAPVGKL